MKRTLLAGLVALALRTPLALADGLIYQLPPDGTGALFETETTFTRDGQERTAKGTLTISSVGQATADNEQCRWIEIKSITRFDDRERLTIWKLLIPEKFLARGENPGEHVVRGWVKNGDSEPQEVGNQGPPPGRGGGLAGYLAGPAPNATPLEPIEVDGKLGQLPCAGVAGDLEFSRDNGSVRIHFENRLHEKAPFGLVGAVWKTERTVNGQPMGGRTTRLTLVDVQTTALSELADRN